jgi:heat shock protein HslJ
MRPSIRSLVVLGLIVAACGEPAEPAPIEGAWQLELGTLDGEPIPLVDGHPITLTLENDAVGGTAACNSYGGSYTLSNGEMIISELVHTEMACFPEETMASESAYLEALSRVEAVTASEDSLTLTGGGAELAFVALPPIPTADLTKTVWVLESLIDDDSVSSVSGERASIEMFTDGSMLGGTGCRSVQGVYEISDAEVTMTEFEANGECSDPTLQEQDDQVVAVLSDGFTVAIEGDLLTLTAQAGLGLTYRADG